MDALYETLNKEIIETDIKTPTSVQKDLFLENLKKIDSKGNEILYVLIKTHQKLENLSDINNLPYEARELKMGIKFNIDNFPIKLFYILNLFITKHIDHLQDEDNRQFFN